MEQRLIDANALMDTFRSYMAENFDKERCISEENCEVCDLGCLWRRTVKSAPTVDAVPVVRCGECLSCERHFKRNGEPHHYRCSFFDIEIEPQDFCSYGERRDGDG